MKNQLNLTVFKDLHVVEEQDIIKAQENGLIEVYTELSIEQFIEDIQKGLDDGSVTREEFEKAKKDLSKLQKKMITNKSGHKQTVYVRVGEKKEEFKDATNHIIEEGDKHFIDTLDPDTEEKKFKPGDKISYTTDDGKKHTGIVSKEKHPEMDDVLKIDHEISKGTILPFLEEYKDKITEELKKKK